MINKAQDRAVRRLFDGFDSERYGLPTELVEARARATRLAAAVAALRPHGAEQAARAAALVAALDDPTADLTGPILAAQADDEASKIHAQILRDAQVTASDALTGVAVACAETIFVEHLRPKLAEVLDQAKKAHALFSPHGSNEQELFTTAPKVRAAWTEFAAAAGNYEALGAARTTLLDLTGRAVLDVNAYFALIKNTEDVWPELLSSQLPQSTLVRPWPSEGGRAFLRWAVAAGAELWLPTGAEQDRRWQSVYGPRVAEHQRSNRVMGEFRALVV